jgi:predicted AlkP superfamily pyrophosphatase or phosphodiesterase
MKGKPYLLTTIGVTLLAAVLSCVTNTTITTTCVYTGLPQNGGAENKHVILIGLDGWGAYSLPKADMPVVKRMMREGSYTLKALSVLPSNSAPNWSSMVMGAPPRVTGYPGYRSVTDRYRSVTDRYGLFPTIFAALKAQRPESTIGFFFEWEELDRLCPAEIADHKERIPDLSNNSNAVEAIGDYIKTKKPTLTMIVFDEPDHTGHSAGHGTKAYYEKLRQLDRFIGVIEEAVRAAGIYDETVFVLSADHGGILWGHGGFTLRERRIPLIFSGGTIKRGHVISQPVHIYDSAPAVASILGIDPPSVWKGRAIREIFNDE